MRFIEELKRRNVLRVAIAYLAGAWLIAQVADTVFPRLGISEATIATIIIVLAIGFPIAVVVSWLYELTPEGLRLDRNVDRSKVVSAYAGKKFDRGIIVVLTLAIGFFAVDRFLLDPARDIQIRDSAIQQGREDLLAEIASRNRIAVLAFQNRNADEDEYFSDGIAEELLDVLSTDGRFEVISRRSSFSFKGSELSIPEIAEKLGADFVIDGSVLRSGDDLQLRAEIVESRSDSTLWSGTYRRSLGEIPDALNEISAAIVDALRDPLQLDAGAAPQAQLTDNADAHSAYLLGKHLIRELTPNSIDHAVEQFQKAVDLDPDFALAHTELAVALLIDEPEHLTWNELFSVVERLINRAAEIDPDLADVYFARGRLYGNMENFMDRSDDTGVMYRKTIELNPNHAEAYRRLVDRLEQDREEIDRTYKKLIRLDPRSRRIRRGYIRSLTRQGRFDEAAAQIEAYAAIDALGGIILRGDHSSIGGNWGDPILAYLEATKLGTENVIFGGMADLGGHLAAIGMPDETLPLSSQMDFLNISWNKDPEEALSLARAMLAKDPYSVDPGIMGVILMHAGYHEEAGSYFERLHGIRPNLFDRVDWMGVYIGEALVATHREAGDEEAAKEILSMMTAGIPKYRDFYANTIGWYESVDYKEGIVEYLSGNREKGLALIAKAADDGFWISPPSPFQEPMYEDPGFVAILDKQEIRQARERKKVLDVVCADGFSHPVWVPKLETCEQFRAGLL